MPAQFSFAISTKMVIFAADVRRNASNCCFWHVAEGIHVAFVLAAPGVLYILTASLLLLASLVLVASLLIASLQSLAPLFLPASLAVLVTPYRVLVPYILLLRSWSMHIFYKHLLLFDLTFCTHKTCEARLEKTKRRKICMISRRRLNNA